MEPGGGAGGEGVPHPGPCRGLPPGPSQTQQSRMPEGEVCRAWLKFGRISFVRWDEGDPAGQGCPQGHM